jgi:hypothetical protein
MRPHSFFLAFSGNATVQGRNLTLTELDVGGVSRKWSVLKRTYSETISVDGILRGLTGCDIPRDQIEKDD